MSRVLIVSLIASLSSIPAVGQELGVRILLGITDTTPTRWDGSVTATGATIDRIDPWRFEGTTDAILTGNSWTCTTHPPQQWPPETREIVANGIIVRLKNADPGATLDVQTVQGQFSISLSEIPFGTPVTKLDYRVMADRIPAVTALTSDEQEQDYPAVASGTQGDVWVAWMEFTHSAIHDKLRANFNTQPTNFNLWATPPGGDRIWARRFAGGVWGDPVPVTGGGEDLYRPATAVDGTGATWVFWASRQGGDFDLWGRRLIDGQPQDLVRITSEAGADTDAVAATDSAGRVWLAWQGWRFGRATILAVHQTDSGFTAPEMIAGSLKNEWNPTIAASRDGRVTVAWDSYRNGNYDIYMRTFANDAWGTEALVAGSARYEAYPSTSYAPDGRLWIAFEEGPARWGKDWGAIETSGTSLYSGRAIRLLGFEANGQAVETAVSASTVLPGPPSRNVSNTGRQGNLSSWNRARTQASQLRAPGQPSAFTPAPRNTSPRLHADASGRLWLAFRSAHPLWWQPLGSIWSEYIASYDGSQWTGPVFLSQSDNQLDNRPGIVSTGPGRVLVVGSSDRRGQYYLREKYLPKRGVAVRDPYNDDLFANELSLPPGGGFLSVQNAPLPVLADADPADATENSAIERIRTARPLGRYKVLVGEFHRHSEISTDGGDDGSLVDQFRYAMDVAAMDWFGCCDHDNGDRREYPWWITQKLTDMFHNTGTFVPMFSYERSAMFPEGHRNIVFAQRGIHPLPRLPISSKAVFKPAPDILMLYRYLKQFNGITAAHTTATDMGTDWRNSDPAVEVAVEVYQGDRQNYERPDAPRASTAADSIGGWQPKGFINLALGKGYKLGLGASSDHVSTHMSYTNLLVEGSTRESVLDAFKKRHLYGATDVILATVTSGDKIMGDAFSTTVRPQLKVSLVGTAPFKKVYIVRDNTYVYMTQPGSAYVDFTWQDTAPKLRKESYYYIRGEQEDGEIVWASPMWITYKGK